MVWHCDLLCSAVRSLAAVFSFVCGWCDIGPSCILGAGWVASAAWVCLD